MYKNLLTLFQTFHLALKEENIIAVKTSKVSECEYSGRF